jgi:very-short-patch-repair endonuclease
MRCLQTASEERLWSLLRREVLGVRVRRQHVLLGWIVDFYVPAWRLVIEVDGSVHDARTEDDARRDEARARAGARVLRLRVEEIDASPEVLLTRIRAHTP